MEVPQHQVKGFILVIVQIIHTLILIIELTLQLLAGYPVFQVHRILWSSVI